MRAVFLVFIVAFLAFLPRDSHAHPHAWIDVFTEPVFDDKGNITALKQRWTFDEYYTQFVMEDVVKDGSPTPSHADLLALAKQNVANIKDYHYFTEAKAAGKVVAFSEARDIDSSFEKARITLIFTLVFAQAVDAKSGLSYRVFDPSYYIEMRHDGKKAIMLPKDSSCDVKIQEPNPDMEYVNLAKALDKNAKAPESLGSVFAQTIELKCP